MGDRSDWLQAEGPDGLIDGDVLTLYPRAVGVLLPYVVVYLLGAVADVVGWVVAGGWVWENWMFLAVLVLLTGVRLRIMRAVTRPEWSVRIDADGVTWFGATQPLAWAAVDHVVVKDRARWWRICGVFGEVGLVDHTAAAFARRAHSAPMRHLIELRLVKGEVGDVVDAISRHAPQLI